MELANVEANVAHITAAATEAAERGARVVVFPELCLTGYSIADLLQQRALLAAAAEGLDRIAQNTQNLPAVLVVGAPVEASGRLYNCAAVITGGRIRGLVPKTYLPNYGEFYEQRWFVSATKLDQSTIVMAGQTVPMGADLLFDIDPGSNLILGVELCEDLWAPLPPSTMQALGGATVIANLSASNELVGKAAYRQQLIGQQSARTRTAYIYCSAGPDESSTDTVFGGQAVISENGITLAESPGFERQGGMTLADIDLEHVMYDRIKSNTFASALPWRPTWRHVNIDLTPAAATASAAPDRFIDPHPFVPSHPATRDARSAEILAIQAQALATRLQNTGVGRTMIVGLSGGLDSTLALLVMKQAARVLELPDSAIRAYTLPGFATSRRTKSNAQRLAEALGVTLEEINIATGSQQQLHDIGHNGADQDVTYENTQARYRTMTLMNQANRVHGLVIGTGDLSEIALGWCTFNGDHISHYNVNAGVPKTLIRHLVAYAAAQPEFAAAREVLNDILDTPVSPELTAVGDGEISQSTEDIIGPYELHDFFLYHFLRWGSSPDKILYLAERAFADRFEPGVIKRWLRLFITRFFGNQWKRSVMADGPKVGSVALSPRGDWRMPSDAAGQLWLDVLK